MNDLPNLSDEHVRRLALRRFLPGELPRFEEQLLLEYGLAERLREAEYDLIDDYVAGRLSADERADVEQHLIAADDGAMALQLGRALAAHRATPDGLEAAPEPPRLPVPAMDIESARRPTRYRVTAYRWQPIAAALVAAIAVGVQLRPRQPAMPVTSRPVATGESTGPSAATAARPAREQTVSLSLDRTRGSAERTVRIAPGIDTVRLQVEVDDAVEADTYSLEVRSGTTREPYRAEGLPARTAGPYQFVEAAVPRAAWAAGLVTVSVNAEHGRDRKGEGSWTLRIVSDPGS